MKTLHKVLAAALFSAGTLALTAQAASAEIVCNEVDHVCWHVRHRYTYPGEVQIVVHPDNWHWRRHAHYVWREHHGRGYWRGGVWVTF